MAISRLNFWKGIGQSDYATNVCEHITMEPEISPLHSEWIIARLSATHERDLAAEACWYDLDLNGMLVPTKSTIKG